ncbi:MAG: adenine phosphoribosyltransferase [Clostridia bacterium]|nr:adenine phosphoribosyltransferase [Clostridia bacterium]
MKYYEMKIAGLERKLPIFPINDKVSIAAFIMFGDAEITVAAAAELLKKCPEFDYILTPEAKSIPLAHEMSRQSGKKYFVARKGTKLYMGNPLSVEVKSITTDRLQTLYLSEYEAEEIKGKKVLIVDDVISTGESLIAIQKLADEAKCETVGCAAVLAEGDASKRDDIIFLEPLPLIINE